jgi:hypothetical protein
MNQGPRGGLFDEKTEGPKSRGTVPKLLIKFKLVDMLNINFISTY